MKIKLTEPKVITFVIAVVIALLAVISTTTKIPFFSENSFWVLAGAFLLLALANLLRDL